MGCMLALDGLCLESGDDPPVFRRVRRRVGKLPGDGGLDSEADAYGPAQARAASAGRTVPQAPSTARNSERY